MIHAAFQRTEKIEWNLELGFWSTKWTVMVVGSVDALDLGREGATPVHPRRVHLGLDGEDHVFRGELLAVTPVDAVTQRHRHLAEIGVVLGGAGRQRVLDHHPVDAGIGVDVPERVHHQLMQAGRRSATAIDPDVEPARIGDRSLWVVQDQRLLTRQVLPRSGRARRPGSADVRSALARARFGAPSNTPVPATALAVRKRRRVHPARRPALPGRCRTEFRPGRA